MHLDDLLNKFAQVFGAKLCISGIEFSWMHGPTKYRLVYRIKCKYAMPYSPQNYLEFVSNTALHYIDEHTKKSEAFQKKWDPQDSVEQAVLWVANLILNHDAAI